MNKVAIIMSVYHSDDPTFLNEAIKSIAIQSYKNFHLFIYVDGKVDSCLSSLLESYSKEQYITVFYNAENNGLAYALNYLISKVIEDESFEFLARMDSDDLSRRERLEKQVQFFINNPDVHVLGAACREFGASFAIERKVLPQEHIQLRKFSITRCPFVHPTVMFRKQVFLEGNIYPTETDLTEDMALWFELLSNGYKFANLNDVLLDYRLNENTLARRKGGGKCISELKLRFHYMFLLREFSFKNTVLILSRVVFHFLPTRVLKYVYKTKR